MNNSNTLELEILITVGQNKKVPINQFYKLFEEKWELYNIKFDQLIIDGLFAPVQIADRSVFQLTPRGKAKIADLLRKREKEITARSSLLNPVAQERSGVLKAIVALLNSIIHFRIPSQKITESEPQIANKS